MGAPRRKRTGIIAPYEVDYRVALGNRGIFRLELSPPIRPDHLLEDLRSMEAPLGPRAAAANRKLEVPVLISGLAVLPMFFFELVFDEGWPLVVALAMNWLIWAAFLIDFALLFFLTENRLAYVKRAWLNLSVIPFVFPLLSEISVTDPLQDGLRTLRFVVLVAVLIQSCMTLYMLLKHLFFDLIALARHPWTFIIGPLFKNRGLGLVVIVFFGLAVAAGILHAVFEGNHPAEGMWWALVTLTTVGYGDISPVTLGGRITGAALMLSGIGVLAFTTATVAAHFVEGDYRRDLHAEVQSINERLDRIEELLVSQQQSPGGSDE